MPRAAVLRRSGCRQRGLGGRGRPEPVDGLVGLERRELAQAALEGRVRVEDVALHGPDGAPHLLGDLRHGEVLEVPQDDGRPLPRRERVEGCRHVDVVG